MITAALVVAVLAADIQITDTPDVIARWVASDLALMSPDDRAHQVYVWLPPWGEASWHHAFAYAANTSISRSGQLHRPVVLANGWLQRWDLRQLVPDDGLRPRVADELRAVIDSDPYFRDAAGVLHPEIELAIADLADAAQLQSLPVVRGDWWVEGTLSSLNGGRYLEIRGLADIQPSDGRTQEEEVLARFGVFRALAVKVDGDRRVGMWRSNVTAKPRTVLAVRGLVGECWITDDLLDESVDPDKHAMHNLLRTNPDGSEIIVEMSNGLHLFLITDANGDVLLEAPPNLVSDSQVPAPHTKRLQGGAISCIRCHASEAGLRSCRNDVARLLSQDETVLLDLSLADSLDAADEIATRYAGRDFERVLRRGRENYEAAIDELTGGELTVQELGDLVTKIYARRRFELVTPERALEELGLPGADRSVLAEIINTRPAAASGVVLVEPPEFKELKATDSLGINRVDFDRVYGLLLSRLIAWRSAR